MTALKQYEKLESTGLWRETLATQRREVYVSFGNTSLMIRDRHDAPLSHWSLPAVTRLNPGQRPAVFSPNPDASETLEIEDTTMIEAIEKVRTAIDRRRPHPGRLRFSILAAMAVVIIALSIFWLPGALQSHTGSVVPFETREQIGNGILNHITRLSGTPCSTTLGDRAVVKLETRLLTEKRGHILVLPDGVTKSTTLPGGIILLNKGLVEDHEMPEVAAGYVLLEQLRAANDDPLDRVLKHAGGIATFRLLTTGRLDEESLRAYAQHTLTRQTEMPDTATLLAEFKRAGFASSPLAYEIDITGETSLDLIEADPFQNAHYTPLLTDADWVGMQGICGG